MASSWTYFNVEWNNVNYRIRFSPSDKFTSKEAFRMAMEKKIGRSRSGELCRAYCAVFHCTSEVFMKDCKNYPIPKLKMINSSRRASIEYEEKLDVVSRKRHRPNNPNHKRDEFNQKLKKELVATSNGLKAASIGLAFTTSFNVFHRHACMGNSMLREAGSHVRFPTVQNVKDSGKAVYEDIAAGRESNSFLTPKVYDYGTKMIGMTRLINDVQFHPDETLTITHIFSDNDIEELMANCLNGVIHKSYDYQIDNHTAKVGFYSKDDMKRAYNGLVEEKKSNPDIEWRVWEGRSHRMIVNLCGDLIDAVMLCIINAGTANLERLTSDHTLFIIFWEDNRTASTHVKLRLIDPSFLLYPTGLSTVCNLISYVGGENRLPKFMVKCIEQFDALLAYRFAYKQFQIHIKLKYNVCDHHAGYTILRKPGGNSSGRDLFGLTDITRSSSIICQGHSIFSMWEMTQLFLLGQNCMQKFKLENPKIAEYKLERYRKRINIMYGRAWAPPVFMSPGSETKTHISTQANQTISIPSININTSISLTSNSSHSRRAHQSWTIPNNIPPQSIKNDPMKDYLTSTSRFTPETINWRTNNDLYCCPPVTMIS
jgi:hypothetical protein